MRMRLSAAVIALFALTSPLVRVEQTPSPELAAHERRVAHHLIRVQQRRFEARARGEAAPVLKKLDREFQRTQGRWRSAREAVAAAAP